MTIPNIPPEQTRTALKELEQAVYNHEQWAEMLHGTLICRLNAIPALRRSLSSTSACTNMRGLFYGRP